MPNSSNASANDVISLHRGHAHTGSRPQRRSGKRSGLAGVSDAPPANRALGTQAYRTLETKAASLLESVVRNHPLVDGNKRLGWLGLVVFYELNGVFLEAPDDEAYELVIAVASGEIGIEEIARSLRRWRDLN
jgi:death-on-curing protein